MTTQTRQIKVNHIYYDYKPKNAEPHSVTPPVPWIQMKGKWLAKAGFAIDTPVTIEVQHGKLILTAS